MNSILFSWFSQDCNVSTFIELYNICGNCGDNCARWHNHEKHHLGFQPTTTENTAVKWKSKQRSQKNTIHNNHNCFRVCTIKYALRHLYTYRFIGNNSPIIHIIEKLVSHERLIKGCLKKRHWLTDIYSRTKLYILTYIHLSIYNYI